MSQARARCRIKVIHLCFLRPGQLDCSHFASGSARLPKPRSAGLIAGSFSIRRADETERRSILSLLALPDQSADEVISLVATEAEDAKPIGAGTLLFRPNHYFPE